MRIVATTNSGYLLEATDSEVAHLLGENNAYVLERAGKKPRIGSDIPVAEIYRRAWQLKEGAQDLARVSKTLSALAQLAAEAAPSLTLPEPAATPDGGAA